jgi:hypothetical protein
MANVHATQLDADNKKTGEGNLLLFSFEKITRKLLSFFGCFLLGGYFLLLSGFFCCHDEHLLSL